MLHYLPMSNIITINGKEVFFESRIDPGREAERYSEAADLARTDILILFGLSTVSVLSALLRKCLTLKREPFIICVDPDNQLWDILNSTPEGLVLLKKPNIRFTDLTALVTPEHLIENFFYNKAGDQARFKILKNPNIVRQLEDDFKQMEERIIATFRILYANIFVMKKFRYSWTYNLKKNIAIADECFSPKKYAKVFKDAAILVINAGPSLDQCMGLIKQLQDKTYLICVDTALRACVKNGIKPDIVVSLDSQLDNYRDVYGVDTSDMDMFLEVTAHHKIGSLFRGRTFLFYTKRRIMSVETGEEVDFTEPHYRVFSERFQDTVGFQTGGSVSATALDIALFCGASKIIFMGQDLGYTDGKIYCRGTYVENVRLRQSTRFRTYDSIIAQHIVRQALTVKTIYENRTWTTTPVMDQYRRWFESSAKMLKGRLLFFNQPFIRGWEVTEKALFSLPKITKKKIEADKLIKKNETDTQRLMEEGMRYLNVKKNMV